MRQVSAEAFFVTELFHSVVVHFAFDQRKENARCFERRECPVDELKMLFVCFQIQSKIYPDPKGKKFRYLRKMAYTLTAPLSPLPGQG